MAWANLVVTVGSTFVVLVFTRRHLAGAAGLVFTVEDNGVGMSKAELELCLRFGGEDKVSARTLIWLLF